MNSADSKGLSLSNRARFNFQVYALRYIKMAAR